MNRPFATILASLAWLCLLLTHAPALAENASTQQRLSEALGPLIENHPGVVTVAFKHLGNGKSFSIDAERPMPSASLIKLPLLVAVYEAAADESLSLDQKVVLREEDKVPGSGLLTPHFTAGAELKLRDVIRLMIAWSDNTATNLVIDALGEASLEEGETDATAAGLNACNALMERLGLETTRLNSKVYRRDTTVDLKRSEAFGLGRMSSAETVALMERLHQGDPFGSGAGSGHGEADAERVLALRDEIMDHLRACQADNMIPRYLPDDVVVAHKTGGVERARCDGGVIESPFGPIAYCAMTAENKDTGWGDNAAPHLLVAEIGKAVYREFTVPGGTVEAARVARVIRVGQDDPLVKPMQRTLNRRLKPSPELGVDGDFGPNTLKAVKRLQQEAGLEVTGVVDADFWRALGPLAMKDDPVPPPAEINAEVLPRKPQDPLVGPPITTCKAWAIADGATGKLLWGYNDSAVRDPASTTKTMTALIVADLAAEDPSVLEEVVTFSARADNTTGSTSDVRAGEQVSVGDLLYGLMLPSGNDASVALAEHLGARLPGEDGQGPYERYIAAMNARAAELGMTETGYRNPHGLTAKGHVTSARDLVKLAHATMQSEVLRKVVATRRYATTLGSVDGHQRNVVWNNTDRLLAYEGYYGVKTGTTGPAGACLISAGERGDKPLYVVVLGATSGDARYVDARNLYRWAWKELGIE